MLAADAIRRGLVSTALAVVTLSACSSQGDSGQGQPSGDPIGTAAGRPTASVTSVTSAHQLAGSMITEVPAGFTQAPEKASHTGPTNLHEAIGLDGHPDAKAALTSAGFQTGYQRLWTNRTGELIAVQVYRFATSAGARADFARADRLAAHQAHQVVRFAVDGHPQSQLRGMRVDVEGNLAEQVIGVSGRDVMQVLCTSATKTDLRERVTALADKQFDLIAATT